MRVCTCMYNWEYIAKQSGDYALKDLGDLCVWMWYDFSFLVLLVNSYSKAKTISWYYLVKWYLIIGMLNAECKVLMLRDIMVQKHSDVRVLPKKTAQSKATGTRCLCVLQQRDSARDAQYRSNNVPFLTNVLKLQLQCQYYLKNIYFLKLFSSFDNFRISSIAVER